MQIDDIIYIVFSDVLIDSIISFSAKDLDVFLSILRLNVKKDLRNTLKHIRLPNQIFAITRE